MDKTKIVRISKMDIKSNNQKGGITAGTVNIGSKNSSINQKKWYFNPWIITISSGIIVTLFSWLILNQ